MKEQFPQSWIDQLKTLDLIPSLTFRTKSSPLSMKEKMSLEIDPTGTGKTLLPTSFQACSKSNLRGPTALDLSSNTELAGQIFDVRKQWAEPLGLRLNSSCRDPVKNSKSNVSKGLQKF